jgi:hypothetical protein
LQRTMSSMLLYNAHKNALPLHLGKNLMRWNRYIWNM